MVEWWRYQANECNMMDMGNVEPEENEAPAPGCRRAPSLLRGLAWCRLPSIVVVVVVYRPGY